MKKLATVMVAAIFLAFAGTAHADTFGFSLLTSNGNGDISGQLFVDVTANGSNVNFRVRNDGPTPSVITDIFFDDGTLLGIAGITDGPGVAYDHPSNQRNLSGGATATPPFVATAGFSAGPNPPPSTNGVNPGEWVIITFSLQSDGAFADVIEAMNDGDLRVGIHVQAIGTTGGSDSYITGGGGSQEVPEPGTLLLLGSGLVGLGLMRRRKTQR